MMGTALIITGGPVSDRVRFPDHDVCIAADIGFVRATKLGVFPDYIIGDFDSVGDSFPGEYTDPVTGKRSAVVKHPTRKNETDTMLAANFATELGHKELYIVGGLGGRADHTLSNILFLEGLKGRGIRAVYTDGENELTVLCGGENVHIAHGAYRYFSLLALADSTVSVTGCEYPLDQSPLLRDNPYAVSNETLPCGASVTCHSGTLLVVKSERL